MVYGLCDDMSAEATLRPRVGGERRATLRALETWTTAQGKREIPDLAGLTAELGLEGEQEALTENQFLILFEPRSSDSVVIFYGSELPQILGLRNLGKSLQQTLPLCLRDTFHEACMEAAEKGDVVYRDGMVSTASGDGVLYRSIFMPLRSGPRTGRIYIFGAFSNEEGGAEFLAAA